MTSTAVAPFDFKTARPSAAFVAALPADESLSEGIGSSYGVIGYKGKTWTLRLRGETHVFTRPDDGTPAGSIDVIILRQSPFKSKSYYGAYIEGASDGKRPICNSLDGVTPDRDVTEKQADQCALCPRNEWRTDANGRRSRECSDFKRLAVLLMPNATKALLGTPLLEPVFLRVPPASLNDLGIFGDEMANQGWPYSSFVTRVSFDPTVAHPKMVFRALQALTDNEAPVIIPLRDDPQTLRIIGEDRVVGLQRPQLPPPVVHQPPAAAVPLGLVPAQTAASPSTGTGSASAPVAAPAQAPQATATAAASPSEVAAPVGDLGFGAIPGVTGVVTPERGPPRNPVSAAAAAMAADGAPSAIVQVPLAQTAQAVVEDVGEPSEADSDLDAKIAMLLPGLK